MILVTESANCPSRSLMAFDQALLYSAILSILRDEIKVKKIRIARSIPAKIGVRINRTAKMETREIISGKMFMIVLFMNRS